MDNAVATPDIAAVFFTIESLTKKSHVSSIIGKLKRLAPHLLSFFDSLSSYHKTEQRFAS